MKVPSMETVKASVKPLDEDATKVHALVEQTDVETNDDLRVAVAWLAEIKTKHKEIDDQRKVFTAPLRSVVDDINGFFKPALETLKNVETSIKIKITNFTTTRLAKRDKILNKLKVDDPDDKKSEALALADELAVPKISGLSIRENWTGKIVDQKILIEWAIKQKRTDLLSVDEGALKGMAKALGKDPEIPGFQAHLERIVAITPSKVK